MIASNELTDLVMWITSKGYDVEIGTDLNGQSYTNLIRKSWVPGQRIVVTSWAETSLRSAQGAEDCILEQTK